MTKTIAAADIRNLDADGWRDEREPAWDEEEIMEPVVVVQANPGKMFTIPAPPAGNEE